MWSGLWLPPLPASVPWPPHFPAATPFYPQSQSLSTCGPHTSHITPSGGVCSWHRFLGSASPPTPRKFRGSDGGPCSFAFFTVSSLGGSHAPEFEKCCPTSSPSNQSQILRFSAPQFHGAQERCCHFWVRPVSPLHLLLQALVLPAGWKGDRQSSRSHMSDFNDSQLEFLSCT